MVNPVLSSYGKCLFDLPGKTHFILYNYKDTAVVICDTKMSGVVVDCRPVKQITHELFCIGGIESYGTYIILKT